MTIYGSSFSQTRADSHFLCAFSRDEYAYWSVLLELGSQLLKLWGLPDPLEVPGGPSASQIRVSLLWWGFPHLFQHGWFWSYQDHQWSYFPVQRGFSCSSRGHLYIGSTVSVSAESQWNWLFWGLLPKSLYGDQSLGFFMPLKLLPAEESLGCALA